MSYRYIPLCKIHVSQIAQREMLRATVYAKRIKSGERIGNNTVKKKDKKELEIERIGQIDGGKLHTHCLRCGRRLKNPESKLLGYGVVCYEKIKTARCNKLF